VDRPEGAAATRQASAEDRARLLTDARVVPGWREERFDRIARLAARLLDVPIAMINLVGENQWTKAAHGIAGEPTSLRDSICRYVVEADAALEVPDLAGDRRFVDNVFVVDDPRLRFYAARPLAVQGDRAPRELTGEQRALLDELAEWAQAELNNDSLNALVQQLEEQQRLTALVLASADEGIVGCDASGAVLFVNPSAARILGARERDLVGRQLHEVVHPVHQDGSPFAAVDCSTYRAMTTGQVVTAQETSFRRADGTWVPVEQSVAPMLDDGTLLGAVVTFRDVTARAEVERLKAEFVGVVSHELRTPLTSIRGSLALLAADVVGQVSPDQRPLLQMALSNAERLGHLVDDILDLDRLDAGRMPLRPEAVDAAALAAQVVDLLMPAAQAAGVRLSIRESDRTGPVRVDPGRVAQALTNLVGNALKFTAPGGSVSLSVDETSDEVSVSVADTGRGMPPDVLDTVFDRFIQIDAGSTGTSTKGSGLGLSIARGIVERSGGRIDVTSQLGIGSTFVIRLPRDQGRTGATSGSTDVHSVPTTARGKSADT
jgi:PAS domain S-box-containing protein